MTHHQLRTEIGDIMRRLDAGESFLVTRNGVPVGHLTPIGTATYVARDVVKKAFRDSAALSYAELRAELDAVAVQTIEPRG
jgi:antitoxin (DNA-binding transcriptional repressor) of toxin-antitoxin stability system